MGSAAIPLSVNPPAPAPSLISTLGQAMSIPAALSQVALRNAQIQQAQQATENLKAEQTERNQSIAAQNAVSEALRDPAKSARIHAGDYSDLEGSVQPKYLDPIKKAQQDLVEKQMTNTEKANTLRSDALGRIADTALGLKNLVGPDGKPDIGAINAALPEAVAHLQTTGAFRDAQVTGAIPQTISDPSQLDSWLAGIGGAKAVTDKALAQQKERAATAASQATAGLDIAKTGGAQAESEKQALILQQMKTALANPDAAKTAIDTQIDPKLHPKENAQAHAVADSFNSLGNPQGAAEHVAAIAGQLRGNDLAIAKDLNPDIRNAAVQDAARKAAAEVPAHVQAQVQAQLAIAKLSPDSFASITNPQARTAAMANFEKDSKDYAQKIAASQQLQDYVKAAQSGNKAAPGLIPLTELRGVVNRVNRNELDQVSGGGSLLDKVQGKLNGLTEGQPIPPDLLKDVSSLSQKTEEAARRGYEYNVQINNKTYGGNVKPIDLVAPKAAPIATKYKAGDSVTLRNGQQVTIKKLNPDGTFEF